MSRWARNLKSLLSYGRGREERLTLDEARSAVKAVINSPEVLQSPLSGRILGLSYEALDALENGNAVKASVRMDMAYSSGCGALEVDTAYRYLKHYCRQENI